MQNAGADFVVVVKPPSIEYTIPGKNFLFMKTLTREENQQFIQSHFADWHSLAIRCLNKYNKFNELLEMTDQDIDYKVHLARLEAQRFRMPKNPRPF